MKVFPFASVFIAIFAPHWKPVQLVRKGNGDFLHENESVKMPVKIRLQRKGRKKRPFYHIVVADSRAPRDGKFIEKLGTYNPMTKPATIDLDRDRAYTWLMNGAQPTDTARAILRFKGVLYKKHLMEGVRKGAISQEVADEKFQTWVDAKEAKIAARFEQSAEEKRAYNARISGLDGSVKLVEEVSSEGAETATAILQDEAEATEEAAAVEATTEETPVAEETTEE